MNRPMLGYVSWLEYLPNFQDVGDLFDEEKRRKTYALNQPTPPRDDWRHRRAW